MFTIDTSSKESPMQCVDVLKDGEKVARFYGPDAEATAQQFVTLPQLLKTLGLLEVQLDLKVNLTDAEMVEVMLKSAQGALAEAGVR